MSTVETRRMTLAEFIALPEEDDRMLFRGEVVSEGHAEDEMTKRNRWHALIEANVVYWLNDWLSGFEEKPGRIFSGEVGCILPEQESGFGIDVAFFSAQRLSEQDSSIPYLVGAPVLAVEIQSPSETLAYIAEKIQIYLDAGTEAVWSISPQFQTVTVYTPHSEPVLYSESSTLSGEPYLPGFSIEVSKLFL